MTKSSLQIFKEIERNQTFQSIRFNNKHISQDNIRNCLEQFFPKIFQETKRNDIALFLKIMKDQQFYRKLRQMILVHLELLVKFEQIQARHVETGKISDANQQSSHQPSKKLTRAALAKRNQETQQQLRKDQIYVRLIPRNESSCHWMLCHRNFPRIQCKLSCNQHLQYLVNYLSNKWLRGKVGYKVALYPDSNSFLKTSFSSERQKISKQPLNNYFMFTDIMAGSGCGQNGAINLQYEIVEIKKLASRNNNTNSLQIQGKVEKGINKDSTNAKIDRDLVDKQKSLKQNSQQILSISKKKQQLLSTPQKQPSFITSKRSPQPVNSLKLGSLNNLQSNMNHGSFLAHNQSNLLNTNKHQNGLFQDEDSIFKSIGFYGISGANSLGLGLNSTGFNKANKAFDNNMVSIDSNSYSEFSIGKDQHKNKNHSGKKKVESKKKEESQAEKSDKQKKQIDQSNQLKFRQQQINDLRNAISLVEKGQGFEQEMKPQQMSQKSIIKEVKTVSIKKKNVPN